LVCFSLAFLISAATATCKRLELDEIWGYIGKKMRRVQEGDDPTLGDVWTFCAIDADTKLVPSFHVSSKRDIESTSVFISDLASRPICVVRELVC